MTAGPSAPHGHLLGRASHSRLQVWRAAPEAETPLASPEQDLNPGEGSFYLRIHPCRCKSSTSKVARGQDRFWETCPSLMDHAVLGVE